MGAMANSYSLASYVGSEEVVVSSEKGRRVVHYYLKRGGGGADLVVVGKEKSVRHMSYHYVKDICDVLNVNRSSLFKLRSRREVIDWMNSIISGSDEQPNCSPTSQLGGDMENTLDANYVENNEASRTEFMWLGSPWTCKKRRRHYPSFCRYGVTISVHNFVYVLAEENKRLVAYLDDIYEDSHGSKMAVVRWFHKIDEVGFVLPHNYNDKEIFFSLCLQDLSIECIDGLATVLSPEHYEKFSTEATCAGLVLFVCCRLFDNEEFKSFDITRVKGYWKQAILKNTSSSACEPSDAAEGSFGDAGGCRPNKRIRWSKESDKFLKTAGENVSIETNLKASVGTSNDSKTDFKMVNAKEGCSSVPLSGKDEIFQDFMHRLTIGSEVEVLSQDSGIRGCWFRASIIKKHKDKVKVRYLDIKDAADDEKNLEEWILASRRAAHDMLDIRLTGRTVVRPSPLSCITRAPCVVSVGSVVDAWWHDGWWEGIVVKKESENRVHVYFLGEKQEEIFSAIDLRHSQEWIKNSWQKIEEKPEILSKIILSEQHVNMKKSNDVHPSFTTTGDKNLIVPIHDELQQKVVRFDESGGDGDDDKVRMEAKFAKDLLKDCVFSQLRWNPTRKRRLCRSPVQKLHDGANSNDSGTHTCEKFYVDSSLKFHRDNWKYGTSEFCSSAVSHLTSLIVSR